MLEYQIFLLEIKLHLHNFPEFNKKRSRYALLVRYERSSEKTSWETDTAHRAAMALSWLGFAPASPPPWMADSCSLLESNRFPGSQNADNGPHSSRSQGLRREKRQFQVKVATEWNYCCQERLPDCISKEHLPALYIKSKTLAPSVAGKHNRIRFKDSYLINFYLPAYLNCKFCFPLGRKFYFHLPESLGWTILFASV